ncbi:GntR family transcriptional regulator [Streptomyces carminius]|uniref:GntR family transcriptional regulator n=1 Tax=Streptomyces carminius TaxID=2665496 RepID=A0A2M8MBH8_9ACTN|nr:winged helix-turn-helix domain-containing protein [Streptomyces carminius]PJF01585.1 GntR family transcriptional regulator [Streptomyces carminius]
MTMRERSPIDHMSPEYIHRQVAAAIVADINSGRLPLGARLAGERAMAEEYGAAIGTARRAIALLREQGVLVTMPARGTFVAWKPDDDTDE